MNSIKRLEIGLSVATLLLALLTFIYEVLKASGTGDSNGIAEIK